MATPTRPQKSNLGRVAADWIRVTQRAVDLYIQASGDCDITHFSRTPPTIPNALIIALLSGRFWKHLGDGARLVRLEAEFSGLAKLGEEIGFEFGTFLPPADDSPIIPVEVTIWCRSADGQARQIGKIKGTIVQDNCGGGAS